MPLARRCGLGLAVQVAGVSALAVRMKKTCWSTLPAIKADWSPVEKGLNSAIGCENGPGGRPSSPSGKKGREILPLARSVKANWPVSADGFAKKARAAA